ncbi:MAG: diacylglycerol kinase family lipid kinase [Nitrospirae bacterium]|nr:diacylglycerol kinase family lipid kinase [Nitrospirota bacterium]
MGRAELQATVILNPAARGARASLGEAIARLLQREGLRVELRLTQGRGEGTILARQAVQAGADLVVAAGGDGTVNEVADGLAGSPVLLGIIPLGTTNVLALELNLPFDLDGACRVLGRGKSVPLALGKANGRCFTFAAGVGFDGYVVAAVDRYAKPLIHKGVYVWEAAKGLLCYPFPPLRVVTEEGTYEGYHLVIAKARFYGGRFVMAPGADVRKPTLFCCLFQRPGPWAVLRYGWGLLTGRHPRSPDIRCWETARVEVGSAYPVPVQVDGDPFGTLPLTAEVVPAAVRIIVPEDLRV